MLERRVPAIDAAWLHMDRPRNTADIVGIMTFDEALPAGDVRRLVEEKFVVHDRFRQRIVRDPIRGDFFQEDPQFSLDRHLVHRKIPAGPEALERFVADVANERLDDRHPLWRIYHADAPVRGKKGARSTALIPKLHHCIGDGFALVGLLLTMADELAGGENPAAPSARRIPSLAIADLMNGWEVVRKALQDPAHALKLVGESAAFAKSLAWMVKLSNDPATMLTRPLSGKRRLVWSTGFDLRRIREAAKARGATVNDLLLTGLSGALREQLLESGDELERPVRALVPVNLREAVPLDDIDGALGNRFGLVFLEIPVHLDRPAERLAAIQAEMNRLKRSADAVVTFAVMASMGTLPIPVAQAAFDFFTRKASLVVTNVPGPKSPLHLAGHKVDHLMFAVPHPVRLGLGLSILSYAGEVRIGARADEAVMPDPSGVVQRFGKELAELGAA